MKVIFGLLLSLMPAALAAGKCNADNCARAVTGTRRGPSFAPSAQADCSSFLLQTSTGPSVTVTEFTYITTTVGGPTEPASIVPRNPVVETPPPAPKAIPAYASPCSGSVRYSSACSCYGITAETITVPAGTTTTVLTKNVFITATATTTTTTTIATPPSGSYNPTIPPSYTDCLFDPNVPESKVQLLDPDTGIPFINVNGRATLAVEVAEDVPGYHFSKPAGGPAGVFDLQTDDGLFIAVFEDGHVGFVPTGSNGQTYVGTSPNKYITTIWSVQCDGVLVAGIINGLEFQFILSGDELFAQDKTIPVKRGIIGGIIKILLFPIRTFLGLEEPRCGNPLQTVFDLPGARPLNPNGCGSLGITFNSVPFVSCCNDHDDCYDTCQREFSSCNNVFRTCNIDKCNAAYPGFSLRNLAKRFGCRRIGNLFADIVSGPIGRGVFEIANQQRCLCCSSGESPCKDGCKDFKTDKNNCGSCGHKCAADAQCVNGACSTSICNGQTCGGFTGCGSGNCFCFTTADGTGFCAQDAFCAGLPGCASNADCGAGSICAVGSCCTRNVCLSANCGNPARKLMRMAKKRGAVVGRGWVAEGTLSGFPIWVEG
ncbi:hypothetical protein MMC30_002541 [Trapelia coarctata]|nr:hypothetical protein [Trapelia coarctata]